jgi:glutamate carboxypeptidase
MVVLFWNMWETAMTTSTEELITGWLASQQEAMVALLADVVDTDSGSYDKAGVNAVGETFIRYFESVGMTPTREPHTTFGDAIHVRLDETPSNEKPIVLMGHRDTVFSKGEAGRRPFRIENGRAYGPGVADMKAGLVMNAFVMAAFKRFGGNPAPMAVLITADEEIASPSSRPIIERVARGARCVFNAEPGRPTGAVVVGRKGGMFMVMEVVGKAAHSGGAFEKGISAIGEIAHKIVAIHALTDLKRGVTLNVGLVRGGQSVNTTAPDATADIDMRYVHATDRAKTLAAIERIVATSTVPGATATLTIRGEFLPLNTTPDSEAMFAGYRDAAKDAGLEVVGEFSGGCADSGFTAAVGCPTLCSTGPVGGNAHTADEYLEVASIVPRAQALALAILRLSPTV